MADAAQFETIEELVQKLTGGRPVVAVFGPGFVSPMGFQHVHRLTGAHPEVGAVFAVNELSTDVLQQALRAGARDAVVIGGEASLHQSVDRVGELLARLRDAQRTDSGDPYRRARPSDRRLLTEGWGRQDLHRDQRRGGDGEAITPTRWCSSTVTSSSATSR